LCYIDACSPAWPGMALGRPPAGGGAPPKLAGLKGIGWGGGGDVRLAAGGSPGRDRWPGGSPGRPGSQGGKDGCGRRAGPFRFGRYVIAKRDPKSKSFWLKPGLLSRLRQAFRQAGRGGADASGGGETAENMDIPGCGDERAGPVEGDAGGRRGMCSVGERLPAGGPDGCRKPYCRFWTARSRAGVNFAWGEPALPGPARGTGEGCRIGGGVSWPSRTKAWAPVLGRGTGKQERLGTGSGPVGRRVSVQVPPPKGSSTRGLSS
jgi:hypothetical protein